MKVFIFLPDGVGLKNFAFTNFFKVGEQKGMNIKYWNRTVFDIKNTLGFDSIAVPLEKPSALSDLYKRAKINAELKYHYQQTKDIAFLDYIFPHSYKGIKNLVKSLVVDILTATHQSPRGITRLVHQIEKTERKTAYYKACVAQLEKERPDFVFCSNQRPLEAVAPMLAAQSLGIPTATFIFSWDNLPKATLLLQTDYYFVWSDFMKQELLQYYPSIQPSQVKVTGTPQFEPHYDVETYMSKSQFFKQYALDFNKEYICFSGDDVTTSPNDEYYLEDTAKVVRALNQRGYSLGILFRKCPVDHTGRYQKIIDEYKDVIVSIDPLWKPIGKQWNQIMPSKEDLVLLTNISKHCIMVMNVASSMVFDFAIHNHPCMYYNYVTQQLNNKQWSTKKMYNFIHFRSMPSSEAVLWANAQEDIEKVILKVLQKQYSLESTQQWYQRITNNFKQQASENIWNEIQQIHASR